MKKVLYIFLGLVGIVVLGAGGFVVWVIVSSNAAMNATYDVAGMDIPIPTDSTSIAWGKHLTATRGCTDCHGVDFSGATIDMGPLGLYSGPNLTSGEGGIGGVFDTRDWERAIRHGVGVGGVTLIVMPALEYYYLSDEDLGCIIAYLKTIPPVDREPGPVEVGPVGRLLVANKQMKLITSAKYVPHDAPRPTVPEMGATADYGQYVAYTCIGCHGEHFQGGVTFGPDIPPSANLTPAGLAEYDMNRFEIALRSGLKANGEMINEFMPYKNFAQFTPTEVEALWLYLQGITPIENEF